MDKLMLWALLILGIVLFVLCLRSPLRKDLILVFLLKGYFSSFIGTIVAKEHLVEYPVRFLGQYFETSILFEYFLYPIMCMYYYRTSYYSSFLGIFIQCALYVSAITILEVLCEKYTNLVEYHHWTWLYTFITVFSLSFFVRILMIAINKSDKSRAY